MWPPRNTRRVNPKNTRRIGWLLVAATAALFGYMAWRELEHVSLAQRGLHIDAPIRSVVRAWELLAIVFLGAVSGFMLWISRDPSAASAKRNRTAGKADLDGSAQGGSESSKSRVQSTTSHGTLSVEVDLDVPWPAAVRAAGAGPDASEALQKRLRELKAASGSSASSSSSKESSGFHGTKSSRAVVTSVRASLTLTAREDAVIEEARVELRSRIGTTERYTLARAQRVQAGEHSRLSGQWTSPAELTRVCIAITLTDGRHWSHELAI